MSVQTTVLCTVLGDNRGHRHEHRTQLQQDHRPKHGPWQQSSLDDTMVPGGSVGLLEWHGPCGGISFGHSHRWYPRPWASAGPLGVTRSHRYQSTQATRTASGPLMQARPLATAQVMTSSRPQGASVLLMPSRSSLPSPLQTGLSQQHMNPSASLSSFTHPILTHHDCALPQGGRWPGTWLSSSHPGLVSLGPELYN